MLVSWARLIGQQGPGVVCLDLTGTGIVSVCHQADFFVDASTQNFPSEKFFQLMNEGDPTHGSGSDLGLDCYRV